LKVRFFACGGGICGLPAAVGFDCVFACVALCLYACGVGLSLN
jgi:hypothetical protein